MFRVIFLRNDNIESQETFIDAQAYETVEHFKEKGLPDVARWIAERHNKNERWTAEIVNVIWKLERTGGSDGKTNEAIETKVSNHGERIAKG